MKKIVIILCVFFTITARGQAHLGATENEIKNLHPENTWKSDYANNGTKYIYTDFDYGSFYYYFDKETKLSNSCIQFPFNVGRLNGQVEAYNKKYVITSDTSWTAYLEDGGIMYIKLRYDKETKISYFTYSNTK